MDASIRFKTSNISQLIEDARRLDLVCTLCGPSVAFRTLPKTFSYFDEQPCAFIRLGEIGGFFYILRSTPFIMENVVKPLVACALLLDCMVPSDGPPLKYLAGGEDLVYGNCHRFDQSVLAIVLYRSFGTGIYNRTQAFDNKYFEYNPNAE
ncbi:hypothetical protein DPMN_100760 [Dreissena polymorpha]|uniref:Uncharacterized protein n=2 Tax=Dreissena polymorpha TaxID=45954 RepID=A0A9D4LGG8_DREPO|nr:hypothetical protein DPMN_100760 [Dreissena polymorpha]